MCPTRHVTHTCLDERSQQSRRRGAPVAEVPRGRGPADHLEQTDIRDHVTGDAEGVDCEENLERSIQTLEIQGVVTGYKEPRRGADEHIRSGLDIRGDFRRDSTQNRLDRTRRNSSGLGFQGAEEVTATGPFALARKRVQNTATARGEGLTETDPVDRVELVSGEGRDGQRVSVGVGAPGVNEIAAALLWGCVANRGELEVAEGDRGEAEIVEHCAHLVDDLDDADDGFLVEVGAGGFGSNSGKDFGVVDLGRCVAAGSRPKEAFRERIEQRLVGLEDGRILGGDLDCPDDTLGYPVPLSAGSWTMDGNFAMPEGAEEVGELLCEALFRPPIRGHVAACR